MSKYFRLCVVTFLSLNNLTAHLELDILSSTDSFIEDVFVAKDYPGAQLWFDYMITKYPQAKLESVHFCVSDNYQAGTHVIYFPEFRLKRMNQVFGSLNSKKITDAMLAEFAEDEYLLLHEAKHVMCNDFAHGNKVMDAAFYAFMSFSLTVLANQGVKALDSESNKKLFEKIDHYALGGIAVTATLSAPIICLYARFQERRADAFANQTADKRALKAGILWFSRLNTLMNFETIDIPHLIDPLFKFIQDPCHQTPKFRQQQAFKVYNLRFGSEKNLLNLKACL